MVKENEPHKLCTQAYYLEPRPRDDEFFGEFEYNRCRVCVRRSHMLERISRRDTSNTDNTTTQTDSTPVRKNSRGMKKRREQRCGERVPRARGEAAAKIDTDGKNLKSTSLSCLDSNMSRVQPLSATPFVRQRPLSAENISYVCVTRVNYLPILSCRKRKEERKGRRPPRISISLPVRAIIRENPVPRKRSLIQRIDPHRWFALIN